MSGNKKGFRATQISNTNYLRVRKLAAKAKRPLIEFLDEVLTKGLQQQFGSDEEFMPEPPEELKHLFTQKD